MSHLSEQTFKVKTGDTPESQLDNVRLEKAKGLHRPVTEPIASHYAEWNLTTCFIVTFGVSCSWGEDVY